MTRGIQAAAPPAPIAAGKAPGARVRTGLRLVRELMLVGAVSVLVTLGGVAAAQASDDWYGIVKVKKVIDQPRQRKPLEPIDNDFPSYEITREIQVWKGSIRFLPNDKSVSSLSFRAERAYQRTTSKRLHCIGKNEGTYRDTEKHYYKTTGAGVFESGDHLYMPLNSDGSYGTSVFIQPDGISNAVTRANEFRDTLNSCRQNPHTTKSEHPDPMPAIVTGVEVPVTGKAEPDAMMIKGGKTWTDKQDGVTLTTTASWNLTRKAPNVRAVITGPKTFERAATIKLDGSRSTGPIKDYNWDFDIDEDCTRPYENETDPLTAKGKSITMQALCSFTATLTVEGKDSSDSMSFFAEVEPRKGKQWTTTFSSTPGPRVTSRMYYDAMQLGVNQCALHGLGYDSAHYIHTDSRNNSTWKDVGYKVAKVKDHGPFGGMFYIESQQLQVDRLERVNANLLPGGEVYAINQAKNNLAALNDLAAQVKAHEEGHSALQELALKELGDEGDPARRLEAIVDLSEKDVVKVADGIVRGANSFLGDATAEEHVHNLLRSKGFTRKVSVWFPLRSEDSKIKTPVWHLGKKGKIPVKPKILNKPLGTLSDIGDTN